MIEDILDTGLETSNLTLSEDYEETNSTDTSAGEDIRNMFENIHRISPFVLAVVGGGIMLSVLICTVLALVIRINMRRREKENKKIDKTGRSSLRSTCGGFEQPPYLRMRDPVRVNSSRFTHRYALCKHYSHISTTSPTRSVDYPSQYRKVEQPSAFQLTNSILNTPPKQTYYPVVTPSTTFHTPPPPHHPTRPTAGLYQTRLRNPRPLSCMPGIGLDYIPKARLSSPPVVPLMDGRGYVPHIPAPLQVARITLCLTNCVCLGQV
jgi:hypothetical protein